MSGKRGTTDDDSFIPRPSWFAQQLGWVSGPTSGWSWDRLLKIAERHYWTNKPTEEQPRAI